MTTELNAQNIQAEAEDHLEPDGLANAARIFDEALQMPDAERAAFVERACGDDAELRRIVARMLQGHARAGGMLDQPVMAAAASLLGEAETTDALSGRQFGHYEIIRRLGAGGMGEVYLARDLTLDRQVALKILPREFTRDPDRVHRFAREAKAASALNHPNIITIHEIGALQTDEGELHFIATEYVEGETLRQRLKGGRVNWAVALDAAIQTAAALEAAHRAGIVHRDIKPENLMLRPDGYLKVLDFGLARINKPAQHDADDSTTRRFLETHPGVVMGTLSYMSPEQARGERVDGRADLWSLGVVLYELLTGARPFNAATLPDMMVALLEREPAPLTQFLPHAPPELDAALRRALRKDPAARFQSAQEFGQALKEIQRRVDETPTLAPTPAVTDSEAPTRVFAKLTEPAARQATLPAAAQPAVAPAAAPSEVQPVAARRWLPWALAAGLLAGGAALWRQWLVTPPVVPSLSTVTTAPVAPERSLRVWLTVQRMQGGAPLGNEYASLGNEPFERGWKFRINCDSPQAGYLYLLNEAESGSLTLLPAFRADSAQLAANTLFQSSVNTFAGKPGTDHLHLIWAAQALPEFEAVRDVLNPNDQGRITDMAKLKKVLAFLAAHPEAQVKADESAKKLVARGTGTVLLASLALEYR